MNEKLNQIFRLITLTITLTTWNCSFFFLILSQKAFSSSLKDLPSYSEAKNVLKSMPQNIRDVVDQAPPVYEFKSRIDNKSSVDYRETTLQHALIAGLKAYMGAVAREGYRYRDSTRAQRRYNEVLEKLNSYFRFGPTNDLLGGEHRHVFQVQKNLGGHEIPVKETTYNDIYSGDNKVNLFNNIAGNNFGIVHALKGLDFTQSLFFNNLGGRLLKRIKADRHADALVEPKDFIISVFHVLALYVARRSPFTIEGEWIEKASVDKNGVDLKEWVDKFLQGAVSFWQAARSFSVDQENQGLNANNEDPCLSDLSERNFTCLEHTWDRSFGYFGAARDYSKYTDRQIKSKFSRDTNGDGKISLLEGESNMPGVAINAGRIDLIAQERGDGGLNLSGEAFDSFLKGRQLITKKPQGYLPFVKAYASVALGAWERTLMAVAIHYLNRTVYMIDKFDMFEYSFAKLAKYWSEMKGYAMLPQFYSNSIMSSKHFDALHKEIGNQPFIDSDYKSTLIGVRNSLQVLYGFSKANVENF